MNPLTELQIAEIFQLIDSADSSNINKSDALVFAVEKLQSHVPWFTLIEELKTLINKPAKKQKQDAPKLSLT